MPSIGKILPKVEVRFKMNLISPVLLDVI